MSIIEMETPAPVVEIKSSYSSAHKKYYEANKQKILERQKDSKPYKAFYEKNKERLKQRALERYYEKKLVAELANDNTQEE